MSITSVLTVSSHPLPSLSPLPRRCPDLAPPLPSALAHLPPLHALCYLHSRPHLQSRHPHWLVGPVLPVLLAGSTLPATGVTNFTRSVTAVSTGLAGNTISSTARSVRAGSTWAGRMCVLGPTMTCSANA